MSVHVNLPPQLLEELAEELRPHETTQAFVERAVRHALAQRRLHRRQFADELRARRLEASFDTALARLDGLIALYERPAQ